MLQLKKFPDNPVSTQEEARGSRPYPEEPRIHLIARDEGSFPCLVRKEFPAFPSYLLDFVELQQVLSTYDGDLRDPLWLPLERPIPMRVARGPLGIPLPSMPGPKTLCGVRAGT